MTKRETKAPHSRRSTLPISSKARVAKAQALAYPPVVGSQFGFGKKALGIVNYARVCLSDQ
jgi:hypothetical protein